MALSCDAEECYFTACDLWKFYKNNDGAIKPAKFTACLKHTALLFSDILTFSRNHQSWARVPTKVVKKDQYFYTINWQNNAKHIC